ncbi:MAG: cell wall-binding repeat-containing protein [Candidatus Limnocylindrales bacterium]
MPRHRIIAGMAIVATALLLVSAGSLLASTPDTVAPDMAVAPQSTAPSCSGWTSTYAPPLVVRVGMVVSGSVASVSVVPFDTYVQTVLAAEWGTSNDARYLQIGAIAVKQYAWYYTMHGRAGHTFGGACFDVRSDGYDQVYDPVHHVASAQDKAAVVATWQISLRKAGVFFLPHYNGTTGSKCGTGGYSTGTLLPQNAIHDCLLNDGMSRNAALHLYLDKPTPPASIDDLVNLAGGDRYATAVAISAWRFKPSVPAVVVASGANFPDALAGGPLAAQLGAPVLLLPPSDTVPAGVATELQRLMPAKIFVLGSNGAVSDLQATALAAFVPGQDAGKVIRLAGPTRYDTAIAVSGFAFPSVGGVSPHVPVVYVANGSLFPDAMAGASAGARMGGPVLIEDPTQPLAGQAALEAELTRLAPAKIVVLGSAASVSDAMFQALQAFVPTPADLTRVAGPDRYSTAAALAAATYAAGEPDLFIASGLNFPDGLAGAALGGPILFVPNAAPVPFAALYEVGQLAAGQLVILGSNGAVGDSAVAAVGYAQELPPTPSPSPTPTPKPTVPPPSAP